MAQFVCPIDGEGFDQKSRFERHMASSHPKSALTAADLEHALAGITYPTGKAALIVHAGRRVPEDSDVMSALRSLPDRTFRDAAEVGIAWGEVKAKHPTEASMEFVGTEPPSVLGGEVAAASLSAAGVATILGGIDFPATRDDLVEHARRQQGRVKEPHAILKLIGNLPDRSYQDMADVEEAVGEVL
jgi:hypothetical protein